MIIISSPFWILFVKKEGRIGLGGLLLKEIGYAAGWAVLASLAVTIMVYLRLRRRKT